MAVLARTLKQLGHLDGGLFVSLAEKLQLRIARAEARREFSTLSDRMLMDVGVDPEDVRDENDLPAWRA